MYGCLCPGLYIFDRKSAVLPWRVLRPCEYDLEAHRLLSRSQWEYKKRLQMMRAAYNHQILSFGGKHISYPLPSNSTNVKILQTAHNNSKMSRGVYGYQGSLPGDRFLTCTSPANMTLLKLPSFTKYYSVLPFRRLLLCSALLSDHKRLAARLVGVLVLVVPWLLIQLTYGILVCLVRIFGAKPTAPRRLFGLRVGSGVCRMGLILGPVLFWYCGRSFERSLEYWRICREYLGLQWFSAAEVYRSLLAGYNILLRWTNLSLRLWLALSTTDSRNLS